MKEPVRDIDLIIEKAKQRLPEVRVYQIHKTHPADDNGVWIFSLPNVESDIQIESSYGVCPFIVETNEQCCADARTASSIDDAVLMIVDYLKSVSLKNDPF